MTLDFAAVGRWFASDEPTPEALHREEYMTERRVAAPGRSEDVAIPADFDMLEAERILRAAGVATI